MISSGIDMSQKSNLSPTSISGLNTLTEHGTLSEFKVNKLNSSETSVVSTVKRNTILPITNTSLSKSSVIVCESADSTNFSFIINPKATDDEGELCIDESISSSSSIIQSDKSIKPESKKNISAETYYLPIIIFTPSLSAQSLVIPSTSTVTPPKNSKLNTDTLVLKFPNLSSIPTSQLQTIFEYAVIPSHYSELPTLTQIWIRPLFYRKIVSYLRRISLSEPKSH